MSEENKNAARDESENPPIPPSASTEYVEEPDDNIGNTEEQTESGKQKNKKTKDFIIKDPHKTANKIGWISLFVNGGISLALAIVTYLLFLKTVEANKTSQDALAESKRANDISKATLEDSRMKDSASAERQKIIDAFELGKEERNRTKDSITIGLAQQSLESQRFYAQRSDSNFIKSIRIATNALDVSKESIEKIQKNFERENRAIMFVSQFRADTFKLGSKINFFVEFKNFGKSPTILIEVAISITLDTSFFVKEDKFKYTTKDITYVNLFLPVNGVFAKNLNLNSLPEMAFNQIIDGRLKFFVYGEATYFDIIRKQYSSYQFCFRVQPTTGRFTPTPNHNMIREMYEIPNK